MLAGIFAGDRPWILPAIIIATGGVLLVCWLQRRHLNSLRLPTLLRSIGWLLITACLVNPLQTTVSPKPGANVIAVVTDVSQSQTVQDQSGQSRSQILQDALKQAESKDRQGWLTRISQDFELQRYTVGNQLKRVSTYESLAFSDNATQLNTALSQLNRRFSGQPLAAIVLLTDGNATDISVANTQLPVPVYPVPVYPVIVPDQTTDPDLSIDQTSVTQTAFDDAPVTLSIGTQVENDKGYQRHFQLSNSAGEILETKTIAAQDNGTVRFQVRPTNAGTVFYTVTASLRQPDSETDVQESLLANNVRQIAVDRGSRKRRILYVSGRPNWEFKFLRRAIETDPQTNLVGLIRIAKREAKFDFRGRDGESSNSLFRGFDETEQELAEDFDEPVLVRIGTTDATELDGGFPESAAELFAYDALIIDDLEASFFTADQQLLIQEFVSRRGGGLLMMAGQESFRQGEYDRTPIGELIPIDLHRSVAGPASPVRFQLTRDGWLQPWIRLHSDQQTEQRRIEQMPSFITVNTSDSLRPGAQVLAHVVDDQGQPFPALVTQRFGRGRTAALCIGDFWRWRLHAGRQGLQKTHVDGPSSAPIAPIAPGSQPIEDINDHARACRQMIRWLVADVPQRLTAQLEPAENAMLGHYRLIADFKDETFLPQENASVTFSVTQPDGTITPLAAQPSVDTLGRFEAAFRCEQPGPYLLMATAISAKNDGTTQILEVSTGWVYEPKQQELKSVRNHLTLLQQLAKTSEGRILQLSQMDDFVDQLQYQETPIQETATEPFWQRWWIFALAAACFAYDWTRRRQLGLP